MPIPTEWRVSDETTALFREGFDKHFPLPDGELAEFPFEVEEWEHLPVLPGNATGVSF